MNIGYVNSRRLYHENEHRCDFLIIFLVTFLEIGGSNTICIIMHEGKISDIMTTGVIRIPSANCK